MTDPDRPRYRVLATPWYDHVNCPHQFNHRHERTDACATGYELEVSRVDATWRLVAGEYAYAPVGTTQVTGALHLDVVRATVVDYLRTLADPRSTRVIAADVEVYLRVTSVDQPHRRPNERSE